jgi:hypothetical protein
MNDNYKRGCDHHFPEGQVCVFNGKEVPTLVCCTYNGSITSTLLAAMLKLIDDIGVFG